jgi:hypothetical protein
MNIQLEADSTLARPTPNGRAQLTTAVEQLQDLRLENFRVDGCPDCFRFDEKDRTKISDFVDEVLQRLGREDGCQGSIVWAASGTGKTSLIKGIASAHNGIKFVNLNLGTPTFRRDIRSLETQSSERTLVLIDEVDSRRGDKWPYEVLLSAVDKAAPGRFYVLAGSSSTGLNGMIADMNRRSKGNDLVNRFSGRFSVPPLCLGDRAVLFASAVNAAAKRRNLSITLIDKFAILYVVASEDMANGHRIRDLAAGAVHRMAECESRLRFSHLFNHGDEQLFAFRSKYESAAKRFDSRWVRI